MILALLLCCTWGSPDDPVVVVEPASAQVGEPVNVTISVAHDSSMWPTLIERPAEGDFLGADEEWVVLGIDGPKRQAGVILDETGGRLSERIYTRFELELAPLAAGTLEIPGLHVLRGEEVSVASSKPFEVAGVLGDEEAEPRPAKGFRPLPDEPPAPATSPWPIAIGAALLLAAGTWYWRRRSSKTEPPASKPAPRELLEALVAGSKGAADRETHFELARLVREAVDQETGRDARGLTDEEWLATLRGVDAQRLEKLNQTLNRCTAAKYAGEVPTTWAVEETFALARAAVAAHGEAAP